MSFAFEKLTSYQLALSFNELVFDLIPPGSVPHSVLDQLHRAALSVPLNIAEGNGRWHQKEKRQFFNIARASVFECVAILQVLHRRKRLSEGGYQRAYANLTELSRTLLGLIRANEA